MYLVIGSATLDLFVSGVEQMPERQGDEFTVDSLVFTKRPLGMRPGGNGANSAIVLGKLGGTVSLCSAVGRDVPGGLLTSWLRDAGVQLDTLQKSQTMSTSTTTVISDRQQNRRSFHHHGATGDFTFDDVPEDVLKAADLVLVTGYPLLSGWRPDGVRQVLDEAHRTGAVTALDIGPAVGEPASLDEITPCLPAIDYLLCNEHELAVLCGTASLEENITQLRKAGVKTAIVKRGDRGAVIFLSGEESLVNVPAFPVEAAFTVGAGDAFNAGLLWAVRAGREVPEAVRYAHAVASKILASGEGVRGCPPASAIDRFLSAQSTER